MLLVTGRCLNLCMGFVSPSLSIDFLQKELRKRANDIAEVNFCYCRLMFKGCYCEYIEIGGGA